VTQITTKRKGKRRLGSSSSLITVATIEIDEDDVPAARCNKMEGIVSIRTKGTLQGRFHKYHVVFAS
jgi:hypothetical protein